MDPSHFESASLFYKSWGPHSVDCFANYYNHKLPKYFRGFGTRTLRSLRGENCIVVPPVGIVPRVLHYLKYQQAVGTLVVPLWPSAHFWPLITHKYSSYLVAHIIHISNEVILSSNSWKGSQQFSSINVYEVLEVMLRSRADTTTKAYVRVIRNLDRNPLDSEFCRNIIESAKRTPEITASYEKEAYYHRHHKEYFRFSRQERC
ncbi:unnamed protein product [Porites evermanni]|uniref:Uncharacterized protein n=1 Tax=Porites evermanni TaxID=104178 RepID=A0ABN8M5F7_9CNID|nr:unnamed protein product [Porites evermanni]